MSVRVDLHYVAPIRNLLKLRNEGEAYQCTKNCRDIRKKIYDVTFDNSVEIICLHFNAVPIF